MQFFDKLDYDREDFKVTRRAKDYVLEEGEISRTDWNGREIRNGEHNQFPSSSFLERLRWKSNLWQLSKPLLH